MCDERCATLTRDVLALLDGLHLAHGRVQVPVRLVAVPALHEDGRVRQARGEDLAEVQLQPRAFVDQPARGVAECKEILTP